MSDLDTRLLAAHAANDREALVALSAEAADQAASRTACALYFTHGYVLALESGSGFASVLRERLVRMGSEPASV